MLTVKYKRVNQLDGNMGGEEATLQVNTYQRGLRWQWACIDVQTRNSNNAADYPAADAPH